MLASPFEFLEHYLRVQNLFSDDEITLIMSLAVPKEIKKKQYVLRQGDVCKFHTLVCSGCLRSYRIDDSGKEHILNFSPSNCWTADLASLTTGRPSEEFTDALEDSSIIQFSDTSFKKLLRQIPTFSALINRIITDDCNNSHDRIYMMIRHQTEERYRQFIRHFPHLHERVPIFMIASYLGVARETLTRIRSNMSDLA